MAKKEYAKRVDVVSIKMVKESSVKYESRTIGNPSDIYLLVKGFLEGFDREKLLVICLNTKNQPINISTVSIGTLNTSLVHPREVFKTAILSNSSKIALAHNHPSGDITPSKEDEFVTKRIQQAGVILGIELIDHLIVVDDEYYSFKENGFLDEENPV
ncbi:MAG: JAB domain-containing protein [Faecalibacillus intestinalis]